MAGAARALRCTRAPSRLPANRPRARRRNPLSRRNPFYKNERKTAEAHILHAFPGDFYGATLRLAVTGFLRDEANFSSLAELVAAIAADIATAREALQKPEFAAGDAGAAFFAAP